MSNSEKIIITEEDHPEKEWFEQAKEQTFETLPAFIDHIMNDYIHDYGTICHAISVCALAAAWACVEDSGITGFQAGFIMWDFIMQWMYSDNKCGLRIVNYDKMLYPQYEDDFRKTISPSTWDNIQKEAKKLLDEHNSDPDDIVGSRVLKHWEWITAGIIPFGYMVSED